MMNFTIDTSRIPQEPFSVGVFIIQASPNDELYYRHFKDSPGTILCRGVYNPGLTQ